MRWPNFSERTVLVSTSALRGAFKGSTIGVAASLATGAAVIVTAPAWVPVIGGAMAVSGATVAACALGGAAAGAITSGVRKYREIDKIEKIFTDTFEKKSNTSSASQV